MEEEEVEVADCASFPSLDEEDLRKFFPERLSRSLRISAQPEVELEPAAKEEHDSDSQSDSFSSASTPSFRRTISSWLGLKADKKKPSTLDSCCDIRRGVNSASRGSSLHSMSSYSEIAHNGAAVSQVVVAMIDATKKLTFESVDWSLFHLLQPGDTLVIMGIITKIKSPLGVDILPDIHGFRGVNHRILEHEIAQRLLDYQRKLQARRLYCEQKGFNLEVRITAGYPLKNVLVREALELHTTWVVLDWHLRRAKKFFLGRLECSVVLMEKNSDFGRFLRISSLGSCAHTQNFTSGMSQRHEFKLESQPTLGYCNSRSSSINSDTYDQHSSSNQSDLSSSSLRSCPDVTQDT